MRYAFLFLLSFPAFSQTADYFPLQTGNQWIYRATRLRPEPWIVTVAGTGTAGTVEYFQVTGFPGGTLLLRKDDSGGLLIYDAAQQSERPWVPFAAPEGESFRTGIDACTASGRIRTREGALRSPLGEFSNGLVVAYQTSCADAGFTSETFLPYVGLAERRTTTIAGEQVFQLIYARLGGFTVFAEKENSFAVTLDSSRYRRGDLITVRMTLRNTQDQPLELTFPSGQDFDVAIRNEKGDVVYRWSADKAFPAIFRQLRFQGERNWATLVVADLPAGNYTLTANLATSSTKLEATAGLQIE
ncbi:MAG: hypothetical protein HY820_24460 [Acidobacteria bacterium]|nr:hypothetical protein [Acidobacteriota bacterium]